MANEKGNYMALEDLQTVWNNKLKPEVAMKSDISNCLLSVTQEEFNAIFN